MTGKVDFYRAKANREKAVELAARTSPIRPCEYGDQIPPGGVTVAELKEACGYSTYGGPRWVLQQLVAAGILRSVKWRDRKFGPLPRVYYVRECEDHEMVPLLVRHEEWGMNYTCEDQNENV